VTTNGFRRSLFRQVNERIRAVSAESGRAAGGYEILCECAERDCIGSVLVPIDVYEDVRRDQRLYVVAAGHERQELERVVAGDDTYRVVAATRANALPAVG
jgi:hypothetical protein